MRREHIRIALNEASKLGPHKEFVVVGSLSVLGVKEVLCSQRNVAGIFPMLDSES